jgi:hypothetical protein
MKPEWAVAAHCVPQSSVAPAEREITVTNVPGIDAEAHALIISQPPVVGGMALTF